MPMRLAFHTLDVFTEQRFAGNPLAVVMEGDALSTETMQRIAAEFNLSETVFLLKPTNPAHSARMRIFTPATELAFAGHPTIGTAALLADLRSPSVNGEQDAICTLEQSIGTVRVGVRLKAGASAFAEFDAPKLPEEAGGLPSTERLAAAVGLLPSEIGFANHKPRRVAAGSAFAHIPVASLEAIAKARVDMSYWRAAFSGLAVNGAYLYTRECEHNTSSFHARMFAPESGTMEDPATGSAAVGLAGVLHHFDAYPDGTHKRVIEQGIEMGRPSLIQLTLVVSRGRLETVRIGGKAVRVSEGTLAV